MNMKHFLFFNLYQIVKEKRKSGVERFKHFQRGVLGSTEKIEVKEIDIRNYAKYILRDGKDFEKREFLGCLKSRIILNNKTIILY